MSINKTVGYYNSIGSRLGYKLVAGGHKHFGYHGGKNYWYIPHAAEAMIDHLADYAEIKSADRVLDAGCGEGRASLRIAEKLGANVSGVDVVPQALKVAEERAKNTKATVDYRLADYNKLPFDDETFDVVFTLETFTHSPDPHATLKEFWRVLKPGGRIVIFDYSIKEFKTLPLNFRMAFKNIAKYTNCPSFVVIDHGYYAGNLPKWGMKDFELLNPSRAIMPSLVQIYILSWLPYWFLKLLGKVDHHPNLLISHFAKSGVEKDFLRYVQLKIRKP